MWVDFTISVITVLVGAVSILVTWYLGRETKRSQEQIRGLIQEITGLFSASQRVGIVTAYENREVALASRAEIPALLRGEDAPYGDFVSRLQTERKLIVIGSSLLGLRVYVNRLPAIIAGRISAGLETKFMMTHPCYSGFRESQEGRSEGQISKEISEMVDKLRSYGLNPKSDLRFYKGTPTCFAIITSEAMLLNPYPYQIEAFSSFCLEVRRLPQSIVQLMTRAGVKPPMPQQIAPRYEKEFENLMARPEEGQYDYRFNIGSDIYGQFYWYHYLLPWFSREIVTYDEYETYCKNCKCLTTGFDRTQCKLAKANPNVDVQDDGLHGEHSDN